MNSPPYGIASDDLIDMGKRDEQIEVTIPSIFVTYATGQEIQNLILAHSSSSPFAVHVAINTTGEEVLHIPTFWDMFLSFFQLSVVLWIALGILYGGVVINAFYKRYQRRKACYAIPTVAYTPLSKEEDEEYV